MENYNFDIQEELKKLPAKPGVYIMHDSEDTIIYVGTKPPKEAKMSRTVQSIIR